MIYTLSANAQGYKSDSASCCLFTFTPTHEKVEKVNKQKEYKKRFIGKGTRGSRYMQSVHWGLAYVAHLLAK